MKGFPKIIKAFLAIKYYPGEESKQNIEEISNALSNAFLETFVVIRDIEHYGEKNLENDNIMKQYSFPAINRSDIVIIEFSEKGVGLGMVAGYCCGVNIPYYIITKTGSDISPNIRQNAEKVLFYEKATDLTSQFETLYQQGLLLKRNN